MIGTTIEQSKKLIKAGLKPDTADMIYTSISDITGFDQYILDVRNIIEDFKDNEIPAWSLSKLIDISFGHNWYDDSVFEIGGNTSETLMVNCIHFIIEMLSDDMFFEEDEEIKKFHDKYKVKNNE